MKSRSTIKKAIIILSVLLVISIIALAGTLIYKYISGDMSSTVVVPENIISPETAGALESRSENAHGALYCGIYTGMGSFDKRHVKAYAASPGTVTAPVISFHSKSRGDNEIFHAENMLPGDSEVKYYCVRISHSGNVNVHFTADVRPGGEKLAEVLKCRVELPEYSELMYDGLMKDMPEALDREVTADTHTESELYYKITVYIDTGAGNEYQNKGLNADFRWWTESTGSLDPAPTGDSSMIWLYVSVSAVSLTGIIILLIVKRKKEKCDNV